MVSLSRVGDAAGREGRKLEAPDLRRVEIDLVHRASVAGELVDHTLGARIPDIDEAARRFRCISAKGGSQRGRAMAWFPDNQSRRQPGQSHVRTKTSMAA